MLNTKHLLSLRPRTAAVILCACLAGSTTHATAGEQETATDQRGATPAPVYTPLRGAPATRVGGGTRGTGGTPIVQLLVPDHTALSTRPQPNLYWYVSAPVNARLEFAIINDDNFETLAETGLPPVLQPGIQRLSLADQDITLQTGQDYQWSIALVSDPEQRSSDIVASGTIRYQPMDAGQRARVAGLDDLDSAAAYAREGYWYDAFDGISQLAAAQPADPRPRAWRARLLEQVGLEDIGASAP